MLLLLLLLLLPLPAATAAWGVTPDCLADLSSSASGGEIIAVWFVRSRCCFALDPQELAGQPAAAAMASKGEEVAKAKVYFRVQGEGRVQHVKTPKHLATDAKAIAAAITVELGVGRCTLFAAGEDGDQVDSDEELVSTKEAPVTVEICGSCADSVCVLPAPGLTAVLLSHLQTPVVVVVVGGGV